MDKISLTIGKISIAAHSVVKTSKIITPQTQFTTTVKRAKR